MRFNEDFGTLEFYTGDEWRTVNSYDRGDAAGRMVVFGGEVNPLSATVKKTIQYQNIHTMGDTINFGETQDCGGAVGGVSNSIRGVFGGRTPVSQSVEYIALE